MAELQLESPPPSPERRSTSRPLAWVAGAIVGVSLAVVLAVQLPDRTKLLGLFPLVWAGSVGWGLGWWAVECQLRITRVVILAAGLLIGCGEAGIVLQAWRAYQSELRQQFQRDPSAGFAKQVEQTSSTGQSPEEIKLRMQLLAELERVRSRRRQALQLTTFLQRRLRKLGDLSTPWPELFFAGEIVLGSLFGVAVLRLRGRRQPDVPSDSPPA